MDLEKFIEKITLNLDDVEEHYADYCYFDLEDTRAIIEYLEQLQAMAENEFKEKEEK